MTSNRPYLLRAFYDWLLDNELTPHLVVNADLPDVKVPRQYVEKGQIVLNLAPHAIGNLLIANDAVSFNARFSGQPQALYIPMAAVLAIYARENGEGTAFAPESQADDAPASDARGDEGVTLVESSTAEAEPPALSNRGKGRPSLSIVK